jgi:hypothetical protein
MRTGREFSPPGVERSTFVLHCNIKEGLMSAQKLTNLVDKVAMTLVNAALLAALPMAAVLFVSHSL